MLEIKAESRKITGKKVKSLREKGVIPAVIYGYKTETESLSISGSDFLKVWAEAGESTLLELDIQGKKKNVLISDVQTDPVKDNPVHVDFLAVRMDEKITTNVPVEFTGESLAVKNLGGVLVKVLHELEVEALPINLPGEIIVDISSLSEIDSRITVADIIPPKDVEIKTNPEDVIVLVTEQEKEEEQATAPSIEDIEIAGKKENEEETGEEPAKKEE
ncbi:MAG: 50S ribosomal protein L25 [Candidatus Niyogibacteria bacterium CG10_big_fil_rev_8_21_14_0_10_42_19]|uniref:Large ribosomal subunit protein bL25 n=1 Tax=Candidatus Niyogibacteria bacterium CG10_big_fil_rev_8_21_14_0_10_42_19 TaxID=1974725 RepID=A0A2H0TEZ3_9BACT|nr:MAG: 50S ribosomal protein L25 [Candidatus Niyogibacteria bacterium CG10_big_fil_rev_8_21_14_0_10_42_19]